MFGAAGEVDGGHAEAAAEFDVGVRVAHHDAGGCGDLRELRYRLLEEAGQGLAAVALVLVVRADEKSVYMSAGAGEVLLEIGVDGVDIGEGVEAAGDAALVGDDQDEEAGAVEAGDGFCNAGQGMEFGGSADVGALGHLFVEDSVAVEEDGAEGAGEAGGGLVGHRAHDSNRAG